MTGSIGIVGSTTQSAIQQSAPSSAVISSGAAGAAADQKPLTRSSNVPISPRIVVDPQAGVITEFLNTTGQIQSQIPSSTVVAYLRAGLNADGEAKPVPGQPEKAKHGDTIVA